MIKFHQKPCQLILAADSETQAKGQGHQSVVRSEKRRKPTPSDKKSSSTNTFLEDIKLIVHTYLFKKTFSWNVLRVREYSTHTHKTHTGWKWNLQQRSSLCVEQTLFNPHTLQVVQNWHTALSNSQGVGGGVCVWGEGSSYGARASCCSHRPNSLASQVAFLSCQCTPNDSWMSSSCCKPSHQVLFIVILLQFTSWGMWTLYLL